MKMDQKYYGNIFKTSTTTHVPDDQWIVFNAKDNLFPDTLTFYIGKCIVEECSEEHIQGLIELKERVKKWREAHPDL